MNRRTYSFCRRHWVLLAFRGRHSCSGKKDKKVRRKHRHTGLRFSVILVLLAALCGGVSLPIRKGYGWPTQQSVIEGISRQSTGYQRKYHSILPVPLMTKKVQEISNTLPSSGTPPFRPSLRQQPQRHTLRLIRNGNVITYSYAMVWLEGLDVVTNYVPTIGSRRTTSKQMVRTQTWSQSEPTNRAKHRQRKQRTTRSSHSSN